MTDPVNSTSSGVRSLSIFSCQHLRAFALLLFTIALGALRGRFEFNGAALLILIAAAALTGLSVLHRSQSADARLVTPLLSLSLLASLLRLPMIEIVWSNWHA